MSIFYKINKDTFADVNDNYYVFNTQKKNQVYCCIVGRDNNKVGEVDSRLHSISNQIQKSNQNKC